ncbi:MAG: 1,4-dihydroxy-2-naphthoate polyprenyltransferase, partial [Planctomycetales bacterium]|nr:1,4-dihydroxy-2-naphthoate polyprenyltransferase [Planctomycetales bacterium]
CPVAIGSALAWRSDGFHLLAAGTALFGAICIQIGTNFCNDYCDFFQGADTEDRKGPTRAVQAGLVTPAQMLVATMLMFGLAAVATSYLVYRAGWGLLLIGAVSILFGVLYTAGRYSLAYLGLGDLFVLIFFGPVAVAGTFFVQTLDVSSDVIVAGFAPGLLAVGLLVVNNLRDIDEDRLANKRTLAVRFGRSFVRCEYTVCVLAAACIPAVLFLAWNYSATILLACFVALPGSLLAGQVWRTDGQRLNPYLGKTAATLLLYTLLFCIGCVL